MADHYTQLQTYGASAHATIQGLQAQLQNSQQAMMRDFEAWRASAMAAVRGRSARGGGGGASKGQAAVPVCRDRTNGSVWVG